ncbi:L-rhamnose mutarotase [Cohnella thermotolerans]|uniref:L-rhamnose mutarotase n=1 Tax=Cohnella thermotolerans TaxID=329858 RepID=UPI000419B7D7|nr:L-rhamnose mutarotase [Cohnella thermotolerans]
MEASRKFAWTWTVKEEHLEEYVRMDLDPWPEIMEEHRRAGIRLYRQERSVQPLERDHFEDGRGAVRFR